MPDGTSVFSSGDVHNNLFVFDDLFELPPHQKSPSGMDGRRSRWTDGWRALDPTVSPDGRLVSFTTNHRGTTYLMMADVVPSGPGRHDLANVRPVVRSASFDESQWLDPLPYEETRPAPPAEPPPALAVPEPYDPWLTLQPRAYSVRITPGYFGQSSILTAVGSDIAGIHSLSASITTEWERPELQANVGYVYGRLPFDVSANVYRQISPQLFRIGANAIPWVAETLGASTGISYTMPRAFDLQAFSLSYSISRVGGDLPLSSAQLNPYDTPSIPTRGMLA